MPWTADAVLSLRHQGMTGDDSAEWLGAQDKHDRIAVACEVSASTPSGCRHSCSRSFLQTSQASRSDITRTLGRRQSP